MSSRLSKRKFHTVFLIDTSLATCDDCNHFDEILLITYRLLSSIKENSQRKSIDKDPGSYSNSNPRSIRKEKSGGNDSPDVFFRWGYKLFSSEETLSRNKHDSLSFQNLNQSQLNTFEARLGDALKHKTTADKNTEKRRSLSHPSQLFATALTETLHDFSWSNDDVFSSPVTRRRQSSSFAEDNDDNIWCNLVFLISRAPHTDQALRKFSNKKVVDSEIFIDSFMTPALLKEYQNNFNIGVNWIDMSSETCSHLSRNDYSESCRQILRETCSKLRGKFLSKKSFIGCQPLLREDKVSTGQHCKIIKPNLGLNWISSECHVLDILSGAVDYGHVSCHDMSMSANISIPCFGLQNVPVSLTPLRKKAFLGEVFHARQPSTSIMPVAFNDISGASLTLLGLVQLRSAYGQLIQHSSQSYMLDVKESEAITCFLKTLEASDTLGICSMTLVNRTSRVITALQSQQSAHTLTLLNRNAAQEYEQLAGLNISMEDKEKESNGGNNINKVQGVRENVLENLFKSIKILRKDSKQGTPKPARSYKPYQVFQSHCLNCWHIPGSINQMSALAASLQERLCENKSVGKREKDGLKILKQFYATERQPKELIQNDQPVSSTPLCATKKAYQSSSGGSEQNSKTSQGRMKRTPSSILQRGRLMVDRARSASLLAFEDASGSPQKKSYCKTPEERFSTTMAFSQLGLRSEEDLQHYLKNQYDQILKAGVATEITVRAMVTVTSQFMASLEFSNPQRVAAHFIQDHLSLDPAKLKEKYKGGTDARDAVAKKSAECKLQVLLLMETETLLGDNSCQSETQTEKLVTILRILSFSSGADDLKLFLTDIVTSYSATLPKLLADIHDELMIPLPAALERFASPGPSSVHPGSIDQDSSFSSAPNSSQPSSVLSDGASQSTKRSSRFQQHPSFADYRQKKQILVKPLPKPHSKDKVNHSEKSKTRGSSSQRKFRGSRGECDKAKRNLFSEPRPKMKASKVRDKQNKAHRKRRHTLSTSEKARTLVLGTPIHKQKSGWHIQQQERRRLRDDVQSDVQTVAESPMKDEPETTSKLNKPARYLVREAFYSSKSQQSRNFAKAVEQSQKSDGFPVSEISYEKYPSTSRRSQGTLASAVRGESPAVSPRSRLLKTLMPSPSPAPKSQRQAQASPLKTPGRPSRRLAKKLDFSNMGASTSTKSNQPLALDAQLIFDGENAIDFNMLKSPSKRSASNNHFRSLKTPEKQIKRSQPDMWSSASCPPPTAPSPSRENSRESSAELNFRNALFRNAKSSQRSPKRKQKMFPHREKPSQEQSPHRSPKESSFSSPGQASRIRASLFTRSPKKFDSFTAMLHRESLLENVSSDNMSPRKTRKRSESRISIDKEAESTKDSFGHSDFDMKGNTGPMTPQKLRSHASNPSHQFQSTPSKVKFSESSLISPRSGSGYPPSAEKSTPGKSILKGSPNIRNVKIPRRIQLQSVESVTTRSSRKGTGDSKENVCEATMNESSCCSDNIISRSKFSFSSSQLETETIENERTLSLNIAGPCKESDKSPEAEKESRIEMCQRKVNKDNKASPDKTEKASTSATLSSEEEWELSKQRPAAIQIRTPSPNAKKGSSIQDWARRKKCSPKHNSNSSSNFILSPTSSSSSNDGKSKSSVTLTKTMTKENENGHGDVVSTGGKWKNASRKRGLFQIDDNETEICNKRLRKNSSHTEDFQSSSTVTYVSDCKLGEQQARADSPELFDEEVEHLTSKKRSVVLKSYESLRVSPLPVSQGFSPNKRLTRQSSMQSEEGSLGFSNPACSISISRQSSLSKVSNQPQPSPSRHGNEAPAHSSSASPARASTSSENKEYSPSLSTFGLASLIKSPFVAAQSQNPDREAHTRRSSSVKPKSRKHLDLN